LFGRKAAVISQLRNLRSDCSEQDWDGAGASPISAAAISSAEQFIRVLSGDVPLPEVCGDPDGAVSLDWIFSSNRIFSVSLSAGNRLAYAWTDGVERGHGVAVFSGTATPAVILAVLRNTIHHADGVTVWS
jgi:hypothetical protein